MGALDEGRRTGVCRRHLCVSIEPSLNLGRRYAKISAEDNRTARSPRVPSGFTTSSSRSLSLLLLWLAGHRNRHSAKPLRSMATFLQWTPRKWVAPSAVAATMNAEEETGRFATG